MLQRKKRHMKSKNAYNIRAIMEDSFELAKQHLDNDNKAVSILLFSSTA